MFSGPHAGKRVLVIDDDFATREMLSLVLAGDGYRVAMACNGLDALERLRDFELPDIILLDLKMPKMDGCAFCDQRQKGPKWAGIPMIVLSATADGSEKAAALGATAYLQKPIDTIHVLEALHKHCPLAEAGQADVPEVPASA
jgi:CheY-like chemotaxis protein